MQVNNELLQLLSEVSYLACFKGDMQRSQVIMDGVDALGGEQIPVKMGVAITKVYAGDYAQAIVILRDQILVREPEHMSAKCFLGIALSQTGSADEAKNLFEEVIQHGNQDERTIASAYLNS
ncbi:MAG TPA: tetratricopeptide repeat protein [Candidatus Thiothrix moscowensis]|uniref:tetratricopeptide repeat protein n=1 Tax=unclassified Thiothrix TaxID=2636184 RepID=UPI001A33E32C|nr:MULTISPECIES: tetratricopeptide repeat protein [unclassified Thiothrix]MBJ6611007.1 tetratricopeptide repeat protein [Candidatus Thiothrix moscowensis]HRJ54060.1 tetratricopeptide repeat protein [Candidatus Thiothrix moscowensis]HRJ94206.1 tetratricopeptide repeat protein [Candidatus Thiothrix moscowensis]